MQRFYTAFIFRLQKADSYKSSTLLVSVGRHQFSKLLRVMASYQKHLITMWPAETYCQAHTIAVKLGHPARINSWIAGVKWRQHGLKMRQAGEKRPTYVRHKNTKQTKMNEWIPHIFQEQLLRTSQGLCATFACVDEKLMTRWWEIDEMLMRNWWEADEKLMRRWW